MHHITLLISSLCQNHTLRRAWAHARKAIIILPTWDTFDRLGLINDWVIDGEFRLGLCFKNSNITHSVLEIIQCSFSLIVSKRYERPFQIFVFPSIFKLIFTIESNRNQYRFALFKCPFFASPLLLTSWFKKWRCQNISMGVAGCATVLTDVVQCFLVCHGLWITSSSEDIIQNCGPGIEIPRRSSRAFVRALYGNLSSLM